MLQYRVLVRFINIENMFKIIKRGSQMAKEKECCCGHKKGHGAIALIVGLLILANAMWSTVRIL